jgi:hypothetical protein
MKDFGQRGPNEEFESDIWFAKLERLATERAASSGELHDLEKAAAAAKLFADARKTRSELQYLNSHVHLEDAKSWAFLAIPLLMLVGLFVFSPGPDQQARAMREANSEAQWHEVERNFITQLNQSSGRPDVLLLTTPLQPFLNDARHGKEATDLSLLALARVTSADSFQDYFVSRGIRVGSQNLSSIATLDRMLYTSFNELDDALNTETNGITAIPGRSLNKEQGQRARDAVLLELTYLSARVGFYFRSLAGATPVNADLRRVFLKNVDLSGVDFGHSLLDNCQWEGVTLAGADLSGIQDYENSQWIDASWWDAKRISKPLLGYLIANQYPYHPPVTDYANPPKSKEVYVSKVLALCDAAALTCSAERMPYGSLTPPKPAKPVKPAVAPSAEP